jgi:Tol biopolymer transport system component
MMILLAGSLALGSGKNKIPYDQFKWSQYESEHFYFFFYEQERHLVPHLAEMVETSYGILSRKLQHQIGFKIPFIFYKTHEEFETTNIFPGFVPRMVGGFSDPFQSRMVIPVDIPEEELQALIQHEMTHIFQFDMLYNNRISTIIRSQAPTWFTEGMASYMGDDETTLDKMVLRDAALNAKFYSLKQVEGMSFLAYRIGHAVFDFMEENWGMEGIRNFLWQYRKNITGRISVAIKKAFEVEEEEFDRQFRKYLRKKYIALLPRKEEPDDYAREIWTKKIFTTLSAELSPSGDLFAAIVPVKNELDLVLISTKDGRIFSNLTKGYTNDYTEIMVGAFNGTNDLSWSWDGDEIAFSVRQEGTAHLIILNVLNGKTIEDIHIPDIRDMQSPCFARDGRRVFFTANQNGKFDIFEYQRDTKKIRNLTGDDYFNKNPKVSPDGKELLYSSSRDGFFKIFSMDLSTGKKTQLTSGLGNDIQANYSQDMQNIYFSSDRYDDIYNIFSLNVHSGLMKQYTDVLTGAFAPQERVMFDHRESEETKQLVFTSYYEGRYRIYRMKDPDKRAADYSSSKDNYTQYRAKPEMLKFELTPENYTEYRPRKHFMVSNVGLTAGITDDGRFLSSGNLTFSDVLNIHNLQVDIRSISSYDSYYITYLNKRNRWQWGVSGMYYQYFLVDFYHQPGSRFDRIYKNASLNVFARYPFSTFTRVDFGLGFRDQDFYTLQFDQEDKPFYKPVDQARPYAYAAFSMDTIRYAFYGPQQGYGLDILAEYMQDTMQSGHLFFRAYKEMTRRSLLAFRMSGDVSNGETPDLFFLGGNNNLRGDYYYNQFAGTRRFLTTGEMRFPIIDVLRLPFGLSLQNIRAAFFVEAGGTWFENDDFNFEFEGDSWDPDNFDHNVYYTYPYLIGSYGLDVSLNLAGLELHWAWAKRTNFKEFPSGSRMSFWIGRKF